MIEKSFSDTVWRLKGIAIFTVFFAHFTPIYPPLLTLFNIFGIMGVPTFLLISGYFDYKSKSSISKKLKNLIIPLLIWGTLTWLVNMVITRQAIDITSCISWLRWVLGSGSWLYFVTILFECILLCRLPKANYWLPIMSVISISLTHFDVICYTEIFTKYCNPFNFAIYFCIGRWLRYFMKDATIHVPFWLFLFCCIILLISAFYAYNYFCYAGLAVGLISPIILYVISERWQWNLLQECGSFSFIIYFIHTIIGGVINTRLPFILNTPFEIFKIVIIFIVVYLVAKLLKCIIVKINQNLEVYLGFR